MGHSVLTYRRRHAILNDGDLLLILGAMQDLFSESAGDFPSLLGLRELLNNLRSSYCPGAINLDLDTIAGSEQSNQEMLALLRSVQGLFREMPPQIPRAELERWAVAGIQWGEEKPEHVLETLSRLEEILT